MPLRTFLLKASWLLLIPLVDSIYLLLNHSTERVYLLVTMVDQRIPFLPYFVIPYIIWYVLLLVALIWFMYHDFQLYRSSIISIIFGLVISFIIFSFFQTTVPRPDILSHDIFSRLTQLIYTIDQPFNAFPSIHVLTGYIVFLGCLQTSTHSPKISLTIQGSVILVILSTLFLKQHTLLDVLGGLLLGRSLFKTVNWFEATLSKRKKRYKLVSNGVTIIALAKFSLIQAIATKDRAFSAEKTQNSTWKKQNDQDIQ